MVILPLFSRKYYAGMLTKVELTRLVKHRSKIGWNMESKYRVISRLNGGIGNQAFQLAAGLFLASSVDRKLVLDESGISHLNARKVHTSRSMMIHLLFPSVSVSNLSRVESPKCSVNGIYAREGSSPLGTLTARLLARAQAMVHEKSYLLEGHNCKDLFEVEIQCRKDAYLSGYWQDFRYADAIRDQLLQSYSTGDNFIKPNSKLPSLAEGIRGPNAAALHIRRSDFIEKYEKQRSVTSLYYFKKAMDYFEDRGVREFYVFSDDVPWCLENIANERRTIFPGAFCHNDAEELWLMSQSANFIISNSSYSWWAAWISRAPDKTIIRPDNWTRTDTGVHVFPPDWLTIN